MSMMTRYRRLLFGKNRPLDLEKVDHWMSYLIQEKGEDLLRYKGILYIEGIEESIGISGSAYALLRETRYENGKRMKRR